jgi:TPR repeat protein
MRDLGSVETLIPDGATMASFDTPELLDAIENMDKRNYRAAYELLVRLAQTGNPKAQLNLANLFHFGWGVNMDGKKAVELYLEVAQQNIREEHLSGLAYHSLAMIYVSGLSRVEPDCKRAAEFSARAKELGFEM